MGSSCAMAATGRVIALFADLLKAQYLADALPGVTDVALAAENGYDVTATWVLASGQELEGPIVVSYDESGVFGVGLEDHLDPVAIVARLQQHVETGQWPAGFTPLDVARCQEELARAVEVMIRLCRRDPAPPLTHEEESAWELADLVSGVQRDPLTLQGHRVSQPGRLWLALRLAGYQITRPLDDPAAPELAARGSERWQFDVVAEEGSCRIDSVNPSHCWKVTVEEAQDCVSAMARVVLLGGRAEVRTRDDTDGHVVITVHELPAAGE